MQAPSEVKSKRFDARMPANVYATIKRAAELQGRSMTDYVTSLAFENARRQIQEIEALEVSLKGQELIAELLMNPPAPTPAVVRAQERRETTFTTD